MAAIQQAYNYYFKIMSKSSFENVDFIGQGATSFVFNYPERLPEYIEQGTCDILEENQGILFPAHVIESLGWDKFKRDFKACFAYHSPFNFSALIKHRANQSITFRLDIDNLEEDVRTNSMLRSKIALWESIKTIDPDFFFLNLGNMVVVGSKNIQQLNSW